MINLYKYIDILEILNLSIIISIIFISFILYKIYKNKFFILFSSIYILENLFLITEFKIDIFFGIIVFTILKAFMVNNYNNEIKLNKKILKIQMLIIFVMYISLICKIKNNYILSIISNLIIIKFIVINYIKKFEISIIKNNKKLKKNKKNIEFSTNQLNIEYDLHNQFKEEILQLNNKISKSIYKSEKPIFVLNSNKEYFYSNQNFKDILSEDNIIENNINIFEYIKYKFINGDEVVEKIIDIKSRYSEAIQTYNNKIYKIECYRDTIENRAVIICILNDITESTLIKNKLQESEQKYKKLMDILNDGVIIHDMNTINYINNKGIELFNMNKNSNSELLLDEVKENIENEFYHLFYDNIISVQSGKKEKVINKIQTKQGKKIEFITTNIFLNNTKMLLSIAIDITEIESTIMNIEQSEKTYRLLLEALPEGIMIIDKKTNNYTYRNEAMIKLLKNIGVENLNNIIKTYISKYKYGEFKRFSIDIDEIKQVGVAIINRKEEDSFVVVVRTLDEKYKLEKLKNVLAEISDKCKFKTEFLSSVASDIKKPINTIFETNKILYINKDKYNYKYIDTYNKLVKQNCHRLMRLLDNIEQIASLENGTYKMNIKRCNIIKLTKDLVEKSKVYTDEKKISINFESNIDEKIIMIDKEKIEKIILNILSNSIKFTNKGGSININIFNKGGQVYISIEDTGIGIPKDKIDVIFENFEQVDRTLSRGAEGSGIGLSLVKKLIDAHGAKINVESQLNKGSKFTIILNDNIQKDELINRIDIGCDFTDNEKVDIEFSDIYFYSS